MEDRKKEEGNCVKRGKTTSPLIRLKIWGVEWGQGILWVSLGFKSEKIKTEDFIGSEY